MMRNKLIAIANDLDARGKHQLADAVDEVIKTSAGRPRAPLKQLDDEVRQDLMRFPATVNQYLKDSDRALEELSRRMRYFDADSEAKELGLDKIKRDLHKVKDSMDNATRTMYALTHGKKPSQNDLEQLAEDFGLNANNGPESPLDFFERQDPKTEPESHDPDDEEVSDEDLDFFWDENELDGDDDE